MSVFLLVTPATNARDVLLRSAEIVPEARIETFVLDYPPEEIDRLDLDLLSAATSLKPDGVFYLTTVDGDLAVPSSAALAYLRTRLGIPVALFFTDLEKPFWKEMAKVMIPFCDIAISLGGSDFSFGEFPGVKTMRGWTPVPLFETEPVEQDIDISMIGTRAPLYPPRQKAMEHLKDLGFKILTGGGQEGNYEYSIPDYLNLLERSKIVINFSRAGQNLYKPDGSVLHQVKGRVFEATACGAMLLESKNDVTPDWFEPGKEYVEFESLDDLTDKIRFYLSHNEERQIIASDGQRRHQRNYTAKIFWELVFREFEQTKINASG